MKDFHILRLLVVLSMAAQSDGTPSDSGGTPSDPEANSETQNAVEILCGWTPSDDDGLPPLL